MKTVICAVAGVLFLAFASLSVYFTLAAGGTKAPEADVKKIDPPTQYEYMTPSWARDIEVNLESLGDNISLGKITKADGFTEVYIPDNATDGDVSTYWEGSKRSFPNVITVDLGEEYSVRVIRVRLNTLRIWSKREQTFAVYAGNDEDNLTIVVPETPYSFDPIQGNYAEVTLPAKTAARFVQLQFTANSSAYGGQIAELEIYE